MAGKKAKAKARKAAAPTTATPTALDAKAPSEYITVKPAGAKGDGAFAAKAIPAGTVLLNESCIMTIHKYSDFIMPSDVEAAYRKLSTADKRIFDQMRKCECAKSHCKGKFQIFMGNTFNVAEDWSIVGAYPTGSRFNHGCAANCIIRSNNCKGPLRVSENHDIVALRDILAGEELTFWYCDDLQYMTTADRREFFEKDDGHSSWTCQCSLCSLPPKDRLASDLRRCLMRHLHFWIRQRGQDLPKVTQKIHLPIRRQNSFQVATYYLLWAYLAEAEGLTFTTCRWRWCGWIIPIVQVMQRAWDKKLQYISPKTVRNVIQWGEKAHKATENGKELDMDADIRLHMAACQFILCLRSDGKILWDELGEVAKSMVRSSGGTALDY